MLQKIHNFPAKHKTDLIIVFVLFIAGLVTRYELSLYVYHFNDIGYHAHIAEMITERFLWYPSFDPSWRLGILVNYPKLFEYILAGVSSVSGLTIWEAYPYVQLVMWSLIPCSIYFLVSRLHSREAGIISASFSLYPVLVVDQSSQMLAMVIFPIIVLSFIHLLQEKTIKKALYFGILLSLLFYSHFLVFTFAVLTFLITIGVIFGYDILKGFSRKEKDYFFQIKRVIVSFSMGSVLFTIITSPWWIATLRFYGTSAFDSPLNSLTSEEALLTTGVGMEFFGGYGIVIFTLVLAAVGIVVFNFFSFNLSIKSVDLKKMTSILYFSVATIVSICLLFPFSTLNIWYGPPWRYYVFVVFVCWVIAGIFIAKMFEGILRRAKAIQIYTSHKIKMGIPLIFLIFFAVYTPITFHEALSKQTLPYPGIPRFPILRSDANVQAMKWLNDHTSSADVVVADTAHSTWILYHTDASTLAGHYGTTRPDDSKDRATAIILASDDYEETVFLLKKYSVDYIYADTTTISGGAFEMMIHWNKLWPRTEPQENIEKLEALTTKVYDREGVKIFKVPENLSLPDIPSDIDTKNSTLFGEDFRNVEGWNFHPHRTWDWGYSIDDGVLTILQHNEQGGDIGVYAFEDTLNVSVKNNTFLKIRYKTSSPEVKLNLTLQLVESRENQFRVLTQNFYLDSTDWETKYIYLPFYGKGEIINLRIGSLTHDAEEGWYGVSIDYITIGEAGS